MRREDSGRQLGAPSAISRACKVMGYFRDTFHPYKQAVEEGGFDILMVTTFRFRVRQEPIP
jgi:hypothetical protein